MAGSDIQLTRAIKMFVETFTPAERARHDEAIRHAIDEAGRPNPEYFRRLIPPQTLAWPTGETGKFVPTSRAGRSVLALAQADVAPSGGPCIVTLAWESKTQGLTTLGTVRIPNGQRFGQSGPSEIGADLPSGAWVRALVTDANGASGVSVALILEL